jgi:uncharacterized OB-fold protein
MNNARIVEGRILPVPDPISEPYWTATTRGELLIQYCAACDHFDFYPRPFCRRCAGELTWQEASGRGTIYSFTIVRQSRTPPFDQLVPYVVALVDLDEGPRMMTNIVDCDPESVAIGQGVVVDFANEFEGVSLPFFRPAEETTS